MKVVIDIPESYYTTCKDWDSMKVATVEQTIIANGKPLDVRPTLILNGEVIYLTQGHIDTLKDYDERCMIQEAVKRVSNVFEMEKEE